MPDVLYLAITIAFFGAMLAYTHACATLGDDASDIRSDPAS